METVVIFALASGLAAVVVLWQSTAANRQDLGARARKRFGQVLTLRETFQSTGPEPTGYDRGDGFLALPATVPDDRPPPLVSIVRLALAIAVVALTAVATAGGIALLIKSQLDRYFVGGV